MWDLFGHYDGTTFTYDADLDGSCIWDYEVYDNNLYASAFVGRVHRSSDGTTWTTIRDYQDYDSWELEIFQDYLYVTTGPKLERYDGASFSLQWTEPRGAEIISMINAGNSLVLGTGTGTVGYGRIYTYDGTQIQLISGDMGSGIQALLGGLAPVDVAVTNVMPSKTVVGQGYCMNITVTVENQGGFPETFNVTAYYSNETLLPEEWETFWSLGDVNRDGYVDDIDVNLFSAAYGSTPGAPNWNPDADLNQNGHVDIDDFIILEDNIGKDIWTESNILGGSIGRQTVDNLSPVHSATLVFTWNTTGIPYGNYIISAKATRIIGETDVEDNTLVDSTAFVTIIGDVDGDGSVVASDLVDLAEAYGSEPRDANWNPNCDLNNDGKIDASDLFDLSKNYGKTI